MEQDVDVFLDAMVDARQRLGAEEWARRMERVRDAWAADEKAARIAAVRPAIEARRATALRLAAAVESLAPLVEELSELDRKLAARGLSRAAVDKLLHDLPHQIRNVNVVRFRAEVEKADAKLIEELCR